MTIEDFEIMDTCMTELADWEAFEEDMATNPYDDPMFPW